MIKKGPELRERSEMYSLADGVYGFKEGYKQGLIDSGNGVFDIDDMKSILDLLEYEDMDDDDKIEVTVDFVKDLINTRT